MKYKELLAELQNYYDQDAERRDGIAKTDWKLEERQEFLNHLISEKKRKLLEIGAGTGQDSVFFQENGLEVISTDLSPAMVERCRQKGLNAFVRDFQNLGFPPASFDAIYALNCLLHVPKTDLPSVLANLKNLLLPGGLFFMGVYGGENREAVIEDSERGQGRFFSFYSNERLTEVVTQFFEIIYFKTIEQQSDDDEIFQSLILRRT